MNDLPASKQLDIATLQKTAQTREEVKQHFGKRLRSLREDRNLSQADLAEKLSVTSLTVHRWETGKSLPYPQFRGHLCEIFQVEVTAFFLRAEETEQEDRPLQEAAPMDLPQIEEQVLREEKGHLDRLKIQKEGLACAIEIARMVIDTFYPHLESLAREATQAALVQKVLLEPGGFSLQAFLEQYRPLHVNTRQAENGQHDRAEDTTA